MNFDWNDFLTLAQELAAQPADAPVIEAKLRSAISRAYYASFCKARNYLRDNQQVQIPMTGEAHRIVWSHFKNRRHLAQKKIGENLRRLLNDRRYADYDDIIINLPLLANKALFRAREISTALDQI